MSLGEGGGVWGGLSRLAGINMTARIMVALISTVSGGYLPCIVMFVLDCVQYYLRHRYIENQAISKVAKVDDSN